MSRTYTRPALRTKFDVSISALLDGQEPWATSSGSSKSGSSTPSSSRTGKATAAPRARWFADLLCLRVEGALARRKIDEVSSTLLLDVDGKGARIRDNLGALWRDALRVWREEDKQRMENAVEMLFAISAGVLAKRFPNYSFDVIHVLAGGMDEADEQFSSLVAAIDDVLRSPNGYPSASSVDERGRRAQAGPVPPEQHRVLQLALLWLSHVSPTPLAAYFQQRRDLFLCASALLSRSAAQPSSSGARDAALLLGLLGSLGSGAEGAITPYSRRIRDWVDVVGMQAVREEAASAAQQGVEAYVLKDDDTPPSMMSSLVGAAGWKWVAESLPVPMGRTETPGTPGAIDFTDLPPPSTALLLPVLLLARSNQAFIDVLLQPNEAPSDAEADDPSSTPSLLSLPVTLLSLSTYLSAHGTTSRRGRTYARLSLLLLVTLLSSPSGAAALIAQERPLETRKIRVCRQKLPHLPQPASASRCRLITGALDAATLMLRHNLSRNLDATGHLLALRLIRSAIQQCSELRVRLEYDWTETWRGVLGLAAFVAARHAEVRGADTAELVRAIMATLGVALVQSDHFLSTPRDAHLLIYELIRSSYLLRRLITLLATGTVGSGSGAVSPSGTATPTGAMSPTTDASAFFSTFNTSTLPIVALPSKLYASVPGWRTVERVLSAVEGKVDEWAAAKRNASRSGLASLAGLGKSLGLAGSSSSTTTTPVGEAGRATPGRNIDVATIMKLIASIDLEVLLAGADDANMLDGALQRRGSASVVSGTASSGDEWLDTASAQVLAEAVRFAAEDTRALLPAELTGL